jgi:magnesium transporter
MDATRGAARDTAAPEGAARVKVIASMGGVSLERGVPTEDISEYIRDPDNVVWVDIEDAGAVELAMLREEFDFHPLALEDVAKGQQRPKVDEYKGYLFIVSYSVVAGPAPEGPRIVEVDLFIGRNYIVTIHRGPVPALEDAHVRWTRGGEMLRKGVGFLLYTVTDAIIDTYFPMLDAIAQSVDETEEHMFARPDQQTVIRLLGIKRELITLRRVLAPLRETFNILLRRDQPIFSAETLVYFQDVYDHILRILEMIEVQRDMVTGVLEAQLTVTSNRLNETMRMLTALTIVVALIGSIFGAWGMNFRHVPLAEHPWGFAAVVGGAFVLVIASLAVARARHWL